MRTMTAKMTLVMLLLSAVALAQTCQTNTATLTEETKTITGPNACNPTGIYIDTITISDTYLDNTVTTSGAVNPGVTVLNVSSTITGTGLCSFVSDTNTGSFCPPKMSMNISAAQTTSDFNRFINLAIDQTISNITIGACANADTGQRQDLRQVAGQACASSGGGGGGGGDPCQEDLGDGSGFAPVQDCGDTSPIIIDTEREGFHLTSAFTGVTFDISGTSKPVQIAWTDSHFHNAFLALPGDDGLVHSGKELFGNFTSQPQSAHPNGFIALDQFDKKENGGNGDGIIDERDEVFSKLRLWIDENHDGICQAGELHKLPELGVYSLALNYVDSRRTDQYGNQFRYKAQVNPGEQKDPRDQTDSGTPGRWTYDVFLITK